MKNLSEDKREAVSHLLENGSRLSLDCLVDIALNKRKVELSGDICHKLDNCYAYLNSEIEKARKIYGITTGFGPLVEFCVDPSCGKQHQHNLLYHLASGTGPAFPCDAVRAIMLCRLITLSKGHSGVSQDVVSFIVAALNSDFIPFIPEMGTVGASGDLTPLAHMALAFTGEGYCLVKGQKTDAHKGLLQSGMKPMQLERRDALALVNGTAAMTGTALLNGARAGGLIDIALKLNALHAECLVAQKEAWHPVISEKRGQDGQMVAAQKLWSIIEDSGMLHMDMPHYANDPPLVQDPYSLRCAPQITGAVIDQWKHHQNILENEIQGIDDNPVIDPDRELILHGGNFHGQPIAFVSDMLAQACSVLAIHSERRTSRLTDPLRNNGLPAYLQPNNTGLNSGFMGAQVTASALVAEIRSLSVPASIQSIPTNNNNQDIVPMGTIAARRCRDIIGLCHKVFAIEALCLAQAAEIRGLKKFGAASCDLVQRIREFSAPLEDDRPLSEEIEKLADYFHSNCLKSLGI